VLNAGLEDLATTEINRALVWQWLSHKYACCNTAVFAILASFSFFLFLLLLSFVHSLLHSFLPSVSVSSFFLSFFPSFLILLFRLIFLVFPCFSFIFFFYVCQSSIPTRSRPSAHLSDGHIPIDLPLVARLVDELVARLAEVEKSTDSNALALVRRIAMDLFNNAGKGDFVGMAVAFFLMFVVF
jgi:hypothetical protein